MVEKGSLALLARLVGHHDLQRATSTEISVGEGQRTGDISAVDLRRLHVLIGGRIALDFDGEGAALQANSRLIYEWTTDDVLSLPGADLVEAEGAEDIPRRHLPTVFVADDAIRCGLVEVAKDSIEDSLPLVWRSGVVVEVSDMVAGLIAVSVLPDEAGDIT